MDYTNSEILEIAKEANNIIIICQNVLINKELGVEMYGQFLESSNKIEIILNSMAKIQTGKCGWEE